MSDTHLFRKRLQRLLKLENITVEEFAKRINISDRNARRHLNEGAQPKADVIEAIAMVFPHWSQEYLIANRGPEWVESNTTQEGDVVSPIASPDYYQTTIVHWLNVKHRMRRSIDSLPNEAHQVLWHVASEEVQKLVVDLGKLLAVRANAKPYDGDESSG